MARKESKAIPKTTTGKDKNYLPISQGAGMSKKGRERMNKLTGSNLKAPAPNPKTKKDKGRRKSFCARSTSWTGERGQAALKRWAC